MTCMPVRVRRPSDVSYLVRRVVHRFAVERRTDRELYQARRLIRAYSRKRGPEILLFGDSAMAWTNVTDRRRQTLGDMVRAATGRRVLMIAGPAYNARIVSVFLTALEGCRSRPEVVVVPTSILTSTRLFLESPRHAYVHESASLRKHLLAGGTPPRRGIDRASAEEYEEFDRRPAPSRSGARRTIGEVRLVINSVPTTRWATAVRLRIMMDYYHSERLAPESDGVVLVRQLGTQLTRLGVPSVACIGPINHEVVRATVGTETIDQIRDNSVVIEDAFLAGSGDIGRVANVALDNPAEEFADPLHLTFEGRERMARSLAEQILPFLDRNRENAAITSRR